MSGLRPYTEGVFMGLPLSAALHNMQLYAGPQYVAADIPISRYFPHSQTRCVRDLFPIICCLSKDHEYEQFVDQVRDIRHDISTCKGYLGRLCKSTIHYANFVIILLVGINGMVALSPVFWRVSARLCRNMRYNQASRVPNKGNTNRHPAASYATRNLACVSSRRNIAT
jgi:hypothetical protein